MNNQVCVSLSVPSRLWLPNEDAVSGLADTTLIFLLWDVCKHADQSPSGVRREAPRKRSTGGSEGVSEAEISSADLRIARGTAEDYPT